jgi:hypothetical protein
MPGDGAHQTVKVLPHRYVLLQVLWGYYKFVISNVCV